MVSIFDQHAYLIMNSLAGLSVAMGALVVLKAYVPKLGSRMMVILSAMAIFVVGSRLLYVLTHLDKYSRDPLHVFKLKWVNFSMFGGLGLVAFAMWAYSSHKGISFWSIGDKMVIPLGIGLSLSKLGCYLNACCYGLPSSLPWALGVKSSLNALFGALAQVPVIGSTSLHVEYRHPTQVYDSGIALVSLVFSLFVARYLKFKGSALISFIGLYSSGRFITYHLRDFGNQTPVDYLIGGPLYLTAIILACLYVFYIMFRKQVQG